MFVLEQERQSIFVHVGEPNQPWCEAAIESHPTVLGVYLFCSNKTISVFVSVFHNEIESRVYHIDTYNLERISDDCSKDERDDPKLAHYFLRSSHFRSHD